ncbi:MAG: transcriptional regulator [Microcoleus sp. PH2017_06_SFM_O_A]|nr:transcriptional regulator [Microcoleus sp. PH2017_06_SFM_O_A]
MKDVKAPTSDSYREYLIESLKEPEEAAAYIWAILEAKEHHEKLDKMLTESGGSEIYSLVELLEALGFKLEIKIANIELPAESESTTFVESELCPEPANL